MAKSAVKSVFSLHPLPVISTPKPPFFARSSHFWGKNHLFRGVFLFSSREIFSQNLCFRRKNQFDGEFLLGVRPNFDFCRRGKGGRRRFFHLTTDGAISKWRKVLPKDEKTQGHHGKAKGQNQKASVLHRKDQAQPSKTNCFSSPPPLRSKNTCRLSLKTSPLFATSSLVSLKTSLPRHQLPFNPTRRTRAYAYVRARALSEFAIFAFTFHLTPQQTVYQPLECEGKPCIHLHLHRNNLKNNTLHNFHCKKTVKAKG